MKLGRHLPPLSRDGRDTVWLLLVLACSIAPHATRLPLWCSVGTVLAMLWRARLAWTDGALPPRWVLLASLMVSLLLTLNSHHSLMGREAGVTLVTVLAGLKTLELRARRDAFVITSLGFFLILTQFLYSQTPLMALLMALVVLGLLSALVLAQRPLGRPSLGSALSESARLMAWGLPLMLALYVLFPRLGPLWTLPSDASHARSGLSDELTLGRVSRLALDDSIAMRIQFEGTPPTPDRLYFRGPVLDQFDGQQWTHRPANQIGPDPDANLALVKGPWFDYTVTLEPSSLTSLPLLEGSLQAQVLGASPTVRLDRNGLDWQARSPLQERLQIRARAAAIVRQGPLEDEVGLREWVQLPAGHNPRTLTWAFALRSRPDLREASPRTLATVVLRHIRQEAFRYTLTPTDDEGRESLADNPHQIDQFWFDRRSGFCEHFATAFVVVMRAMDVPARVVTGFQGAEVNPVDGLYVVRNSDAHAWAEYWQAGEGWVRADPTAAVAPERIDRARPRLRQPEGASGLLAGMAPSWLNPARSFLDAANHRWNVWVLSYSRDTQSQLLRQWGWLPTDPVDLARWCLVTMVSTSLVGALFLWWQRPRHRLAPWQKTMQRVHQILTKAGLPPPPQQASPATALAWRAQVSQLPTPVTQRMDRDGMLHTLTALDALRYGRPLEQAPSGTQTRRLLRLLARQTRKAHRP